MKDKNCTTCAYSGRPTYDYPCTTCCMTRLSDSPTMWEAKAEPTPMTNADRIRAMTDEELAEMLAQFEYAIAVDALATFGIDVAEMDHDFSESTKEELEWLQQHVKEDAE